MSDYKPIPHEDFEPVHNCGDEAKEQSESSLAAPTGSAYNVEFSKAAKWVMARAMKLATEIDKGKLQVCHIEEAIKDLNYKLWNPPNTD